MADDSDMVGGEGGGQPGRGMNPKVMRVLLIVAAAVIAIVAYMRMSGSEKSVPQVPTAEKKTDEKKDKDGKLEVTPVSDKGYAIEIDKRVTEIGQNVVRLGEEIKTFKGTVTEAIQNIDNKVDKKYGELATQVTQFMHDTAQSVRSNATAMGVPMPSTPGLAPGLSGVVAPDAGVGAPVSPITYVNFGGMPVPAASASKDLIDVGIGFGKDAKAKTQETAAATEKKIKESVHGAALAAVTGTGTQKVTVASASYVHVTNLHGVDCPTGNQAVPIVLPIQGVLKGPNGETLDLGPAHFQGLCTGLENKVDGDQSRARIKVQNLSFVGPDGKPQFVKVEGYVVDRRDSSQDVKGIYETKQGEALAKSAAAAGIAAIGQVTAAAEYTNVTSGSTGTVSSTLTGNAAKAALGQAISGAANRAAEFYISKVEALTPVVHIEPNLPLSFVSLAPFVVELPAPDTNQAKLY